MKICLACGNPNDDHRVKCHCGQTLPEQPNESALLQEAFNYQPLINLQKWSLWLLGAGFALTLLIWLYATASNSNVLIVAVVTIVLWVVLAVILGIRTLIAKWQNATMLATTHPIICKTLKELFWWQIATNVIHTFLRRMTLLPQNPTLSITVGLALTALGFWFQWRRDMVIANKFPSKVTVLEWILGGACMVIVAVVLVFVMRLAS